MHWVATHLLASSNFQIYYKCSLMMKHNSFYVFKCPHTNLNAHKCAHTHWKKKLLLVREKLFSLFQYFLLLVPFFPAIFIIPFWMFSWDEAWRHIYDILRTPELLNLLLHEFTCCWDYCCSLWWNFAEFSVWLNEIISLLTFLSLAVGTFPVHTSSST